ncbi:MAG: cysteine hydrolase [Thaumarchaeota archaeon]|nr:cysteine hydrolase [Nitrososphaerota archaeon]
MPATKKNRLKSALLIVDMTNDFLLKSYNQNLALEQGLELIPRIKSLQHTFLDSGLPVIFSTDRHLKNDFELIKWGPHSMKGTEGSKIVDGLLPEKNKLRIFQRNWKKSDMSKIKKGDLLFEVEKGTYSGFTDNGGKPTAMEALLKKLGLKPGDTLFITGLHTNCCDKHTAADAFFRGFVPVMVSDCVAAFEDPDGTKMGLPHEKALVYENFWYDAKIKNSDEIRNELQ